MMKIAFYIYKYTRLFLIPFVPFYLLGFYLVRFLQHPEQVGPIVICAGNITTGGTGKTPAVIMIAEALKRAGLNPCIISRGYTGKAVKNGAVLCDGKDILLSAEEGGDEPVLIARRLKNVPIVVGADRIKSSALMDWRDIDVFIMDDGFQNNAIYKDISIVIIDATRPFGNGLLLPAGDLRELKSGIRRSDIIIINKSNLVEDKVLADLREKLLTISPGHLIYNSYYTNDFIYRAGDKYSREPVSVISGKSVLLVTATGNPYSVVNTVSRLNPTKLDVLTYPDHYRFSQNDVTRIVSRSDAYNIVLITEKDLIKLENLNLNEKFYVIRISMKIQDHEIFIRRLLSMINSYI